MTGFREQCPVWRHVTNEQVLVYNSAGKQIAPTDVSEHLIDMVFGGGGHRTLFILSPHPLFALKVR